MWQDTSREAAKERGSLPFKGRVGVGMGCLEAREQMPEKLAAEEQ